MSKNRSYRHSKNTSKHAIRRGKQRAGFSKNDTKKMASRALVEGIDSNWTKGKLYGILNQYYGNIKYYANSIYVFGANGILVTVLNIDSEYEQNLINYVSLPVFVWYKHNRYKHKTNGDAELNHIVNNAKNKVKEDIKSYLAENKIDATIVNIEIKTKKRKGTVHIVADDESQITKIFKTSFEEKFGMNIVLNTDSRTWDQYASRFCVATNYEDAITPTNKQAIIKKWFMTYTGLKIKINYLDDTTLIARVTNTHSASEISQDVRDEFESFFKLKLYIREKADGISVQLLTPDTIDLACEIRDWFKDKDLNVLINNINHKYVRITSLTLDKEISDAFEKKFGRTIVYKVGD